MNFVYSYDSLDFKDDLIIDDDISKVLSNWLPLILNSQRHLVFGIKRSVFQLYHQRIFVYFFQEARAKRRVNSKNGTIDRVCHCI